MGAVSNRLKRPPALFSTRAFLCATFMVFISALQADMRATRASPSAMGRAPGRIVMMPSSP
eukprot:6725402-Heterocapsa_arctica.AAC.1